VHLKSGLIREVAFGERGTIVFENYYDGPDPRQRRNYKYLYL
jgi:hypothetical protein